MNASAKAGVVIRSMDSGRLLSAIFHSSLEFVSIIFDVSGFVETL